MYPFWFVLSSIQNEELEDISQNKCFHDKNFIQNLVGKLFLSKIQKFNNV